MVVEATSSKHTLKEPLLNEVKKKKKTRLDKKTEEKKRVRLAKISFSLD